MVPDKPAIAVCVSEIIWSWSSLVHTCTVDRYNYEQKTDNFYVFCAFVSEATHDI